MTFRERPALGAVLQLREVPPYGGDTMWADMAAAYDNLPQEVKARLEGARAVHDFVPGFARFTPEERLIAFQDRFPPVEHPVVRTHPATGRRMLFVNTSFTTRIVGWDQEESDRMLRLLFQQAHVPEYQVRFSWRAGCPWESAHAGTPRGQPVRVRLRVRPCAAAGPGTSRPCRAGAARAGCRARRPARGPRAAGGVRRSTRPRTAHRRAP